jgi:hypothetical protein
MADDRIEQAERTPAKNQSCTGRPVESRLATVGEKWDNVDRTVLRGSLTERNLARICAQKRAFLLPARSQLQKDTLTVMATEDWPVKCRSVVRGYCRFARHTANVNADGLPKADLWPVETKS